MVGTKPKLLPARLSSRQALRMDSMEVMTRTFVSVAHHYFLCALCENLAPLEVSANSAITSRPRRVKLFLKKFTAVAGWLKLTSDFSSPRAGARPPHKKTSSPHPPP